MSYSFDQIVRITQQRQIQQTALIKQMLEVQRRYNGDWVVPLPSADTEPTLPPVTPFLIAEAIDGSARRAASVMPWTSCPSLNPHDDRSRARATTRRKALAATFHQGRFRQVRRRYYRHLAGYATCALIVLPDHERRLPVVQIRNPLGTFPEPKRAEDQTPPANVSFIFEMSAEEIRFRWPQARQEMGGPVNSNQQYQSELWLLAEWADPEDCVYGIIGPKWPQQSNSYTEERYRVPYLELARSPNRAGMPICIVPRVVSLDRLASQVANVVGMVDLMGKLTALDIVAQEKAIFPDTYLIGNPGGAPRIVGGNWKDGREGDVNVLEDVHSIGQLRSTPDQRTTQTIDRLERNVRVNTGIVSPMMGETGGMAGALRTGRGIDTLMGASVDPRIQELHEMSEDFLPHLADMIFATYEGYWPSRKFTMFSGWPGDPGHVQFTPMKDFPESHETTVSYAIAGADVQQTTVALGQLLGAKAISRQTFRKRHPWIDDPQAEEEQVTAEDMADAMQQGLLRQLMSGQMPPIYASRIYHYLKQGDDIFQAVEFADADARKMQASQPPAPDQGQTGVPGQMPGLQGAALQGQPPGGGPPLPPAPQPGQTIGGPAASQGNLKSLLLALRAGHGLTDAGG